MLLILKLFETSVEIPPIKLLIYELARTSAYIPPIHINWEIILFEEKLNEKIINNIIATNDCWNNKDRTVLSQVLKNQEVDSFIKLNIAKGVIKINTFTIIYLKEYEKIKLNKLIEIKLFINPSKEKILNSIGERAKKIIPNYECKKCNDTGYILNGNSTEMCSCLKQKIYDIEYNKSNMSNLEKQNFNNFNLNFYSDEINKQKYNSDISPRENIKLIKNICDKFINNFDNTEQRNLLFTGNTGLGKTFLSSCIANELLKKDKTVLYQTASVMLDTIISYRFGKPNVSKDIYDYLLNVDLLIIDDLGTEGVNNMKLVELFNILNIFSSLSVVSPFTFKERLPLVELFLPILSSNLLK